MTAIRMPPPAKKTRTNLKEILQHFQRHLVSHEPQQRCKCKTVISFVLRSYGRAKQLFHDRLQKLPIARGKKRKVLHGSNAMDTKPTAFNNDADGADH